jgi:hypothetical protein
VGSDEPDRACEIDEETADRASGILDTPQVLPSNDVERHDVG